MIWLTVIVFVGLLLLLILAHEWGHFFAAKRAGCVVEEFGVGFPPRLASIDWHGTKYSLNLLPLGGFVKIQGENMENESPGPGDFATKSASSRIFILSAGVIMNVIMAYLFLTAQGIIGAPTLITEENSAEVVNPLTYIVEVAPHSPAAEAGLTSLDRIVRLAGEEQPTISTIQEVTANLAGQEIELEIERQGQHQTLTLTPRLEPPPGEGALGISLASTGLAKVPWWQAPWHGLVNTWQMLQAIVTQFGLILGRLFTQGTVGESLTGPVGIAVFTNEVTKLGLPYILEFGALISLNLALINILPIPALDGGRILFVGLEKIIGRRFPGRVEQIAHTIGFALLIGLMLVVTFRDIARFF